MKFKIIDIKSGNDICWFGKNGSGKYGTKEQAELAAQEMNANEPKPVVMAVPHNPKYKV